MCSTLSSAFSYATNDPLRIAKYKSQCALNLWPSRNRPPRGCDTTVRPSDS